MWFFILVFHVTLIKSKVITYQLLHHHTLVYPSFLSPSVHSPTSVGQFLPQGPLLKLSGCIIGNSTLPPKIIFDLVHIFFSSLPHLLIYYLSIIHLCSSFFKFSLRLKTNSMKGKAFVFHFITVSSSLSFTDKWAVSIPAELMHFLLTSLIFSLLAINCLHDKQLFYVSVFYFLYKLYGYMLYWVISYTL